MLQIEKLLPASFIEKFALLSHGLAKETCHFASIKLSLFMLDECVQSVLVKFFSCSAKVYGDRLGGHGVVAVQAQPQDRVKKQYVKKSNSFLILPFNFEPNSN